MPFPTYFRLPLFRTMGCSIRLLVCLVLPLAVAPAARAQLFTGPIASSTGGAGRAAVDPGESAFINPASVAHLGRYYIAGHLAIGRHPVDGARLDYAALLADGSPGNIISGAVGYLRRRTELDGGLSFLQQDVQISVAGFPVDKLAFGVTAHRLIYEPLAGGDHSDHVQDNAHLGWLYTPLENVGLAFTAYDVFPANESVPIGVRVVPTFAIGGHVIIRDMFRLRLDLVRPDKLNPGHRTNVQVGLESYFRQDFAFRLGGHWRETADQMIVTAGVGFHGPRLSFDYTIERDVRTAEGIRHLFDLWLPF